MRKTAATLALAAMLAAAGSSAASATTQLPRETHAARYRLTSDLAGMPERIVLRHCSAAEDSYSGPLHTVTFEPGALLVLRCSRP